MSVGSGSSKVGSCGEVPEVYFSPVEVNAPESLMNTARAAMPLARGFPGALGGRVRGIHFGASSAGLRIGRMV